MRKKLTTSKNMVEEAERFIDCFNHTLMTQLNEAGMVSKEDGSLRRKVKANFSDINGIKIRVEIDPGMSVSVEKLGKTIAFVPSETGNSYEFKKSKLVSAEKARDMLSDVNNHVRAQGLSFIFAARKSGNAAADGVESIRNSEVFYTTRKDRATSDHTHAATEDARDVLGIDPQ